MPTSKEGGRTGKPSLHVDTVDPRTLGGGLPLERGVDVHGAACETEQSFSPEQMPTTHLS